MDTRRVFNESATERMWDLLHAFSFDSSAFVEVLRDGANPRALNEHGFSAWSYVACLGTEEQSVEGIKFLYPLISDIDMPDGEGDTALGASMLCRSTDHNCELLCRGASLSMMKAYIDEPLIFLAVNMSVTGAGESHAERVGRLLEFASARDLKQRNRYGENILHVSILHDRWDVVLEILRVVAKRGVLLPVDEDGWSVHIERIRAKGRLDVVAALTDALAR